MPTIIFSPTTQLQQIDDFPSDCPRTKEGAIHVGPGRTMVVSDAEATHLKKRGLVFSVAGGGPKTSPPPLPSPKAQPTPAAAPVQPLPRPGAPSTGDAPTAGAQGADKK